MTKGEETFGAVVSRLRKDKGFGLRELARKLEISSTYLSKIENDKLAPPAPDKIEALARILGVNSDVLFTVAKRIPTDVIEMIAKEPDKATLLMRKTKTLSVEEIERRLEDKTRGRSPTKR